MADANVSPNPFGGQPSGMISFLPFPIVTAQDGGRIVLSSWAGSGTSIPVDSIYTADGASTGLLGNWDPYIMQFAEQQKRAAFNFAEAHDFTEGTTEPFPGTEASFVADNPTPVYGSISVANQAFYDNAWNYGEAGPEQSAVRNSRNWVAVSSQPAIGVSDTGSVKTYPANQINLNNVPVSSFKQIRAYADAISPDTGSTPNTRFEAAWDIYGQAHTNTPGISLEVMFWTYNHGQAPQIGSTGPVETGIDLNGDGKLWDLFMTPDTAATGGVSQSYSYGIWYMQDIYQQEVEQVWVDILAGLRYFLQYYVVPSGPGAPTNPLDIKLYQITRGWEICSTNYSPLPFRLNDYKVQMQ